MMVVLCDEHRYLARYLDGEHIAEYIKFTGCETCFVDND